MPLVSEAAYVARFGEREWSDLTDTDRSGQPDTDRVNAALGDATAEVFSYLRQSGYASATTSPPPEIKRRALDIMRYLLHSNRPTEEVTERYRDALSWLRRLVSGSVVLYTEDGAEMPLDTEAHSGKTVASGSRKMTYGTDFTRRYG